MPESAFFELDQALRHALQLHADAGHCYIINVRGPKEIAAQHAATVQVVAEHMVYENGELGLTIHLPFDPSSGTFGELVEFVGAGLDDVCDEYRYDGIPCYALRVGRDVLLAEKSLRFILRRVYGYSSIAGFEYEVYDQGAVEA